MFCNVCLINSKQYSAVHYWSLEQQWKYNNNSKNQPLIAIKSNNTMLLQVQFIIEDLDFMNNSNYIDLLLLKKRPHFITSGQERSIINISF